MSAPDHSSLSRSSLLELRTTMRRILKEADACLKRIDAIEERATLAVASKPTCQEMILRVVRRRSIAQARDVSQALSKPQRLEWGTPEIKQAMQELVESGQAVWIDREREIVGLNSAPDNCATLEEPE